MVHPGPPRPDWSGYRRERSATARLTDDQTAAPSPAPGAPAATLMVLAVAGLWTALIPSLQGATPELNITWSDNGRTFRVSTGTRILRSLPSDPLHNAQWKGGSSNGTIVQEDGNPHFVGPASGGAANQYPIGMTLFQYMALQRGRATIDLRYPDDPPDPAPEVRQFDLPKGAFIPTRFLITINVE
jgi:hypothetical protein